MMRMKHKAVIVGSKENDREILDLFETLSSPALSVQPFHFYPFTFIKRAWKNRERLKEMEKEIIVADYLITFDKTAKGLEVELAIYLNTKVILITDLPYRHYYFDYSDTYSAPREKIKFMNKEAVIELLLEEQ